MCGEVGQPCGTHQDAWHAWTVKRHLQAKSAKSASVIIGKVTMAHRREFKRRLKRRSTPGRPREDRIPQAIVVVMCAHTSRAQRLRAASYDSGWTTLKQIRKRFAWWYASGRSRSISSAPAVSQSPTPTTSSLTCTCGVPIIKVECNFAEKRTWRTYRFAKNIEWCQPAIDVSFREVSTVSLDQGGLPTAPIPNHNNF